MLKPLDSYFEKLLQKYVRRGWVFEEVMGEEDESSMAALQTLRRLDDRFTWTIRLPTVGVGKPPQPDHIRTLTFCP